MWNLERIRQALRKPSDVKASGVTILLLQKKLERFSTARLSKAMQLGWRREYDPVRFFATDLDGEGAVLKVNAMFITMQHFDRRIDGAYLGGKVLPDWAAHAAYSSVTYACPGGIPDGDSRYQFYGFLGLLCAELLSQNVTALVFVEDRVILHNDSRLLDRLRSGNKVNPFQLSSDQDQMP